MEHDGLFVQTIVPLRVGGRLGPRFEKNPEYRVVFIGMKSVRIQRSYRDPTLLHGIEVGLDSAGDPCWVKNQGPALLAWSSWKTSLEDQ